MKYIIFTSGGNDSLALAQWASEKGLGGVTVAYSNTQWGIHYWADRMQKAEAWVKSLGFDYVEIPSEGMAELIKRKKAWPRGGGGKFQFCTEALKEGPAREWMAKVDPEKEATCMVGIRRQEGELRKSARLTQPEWVEESERHGGRSAWYPLVRHRESDRDALLKKTPFFPPLPYRSKECNPCVNANKAELKRLDEPTIQKIEVMEIEAGTNSKGNERVMFSPGRHNGAVGIRAVVEDAKDAPDEQETMFGDVSMCDSGWCGD